jgi:hypothetical protein
MLTTYPVCRNVKVMANTASRLPRMAALSQIDSLRETLADCDSNDGGLVGVIRDLWDGYPVEDAVQAARYMNLRDRIAQRAICAIVARIDPAS